MKEVQELKDAVLWFLVTKPSSVRVLVQSKLGSIYNRGLKSGVMLNSSHVLPAALLLKPLEKAKAYQWETTNPTEKIKLDEKSYAELLKYWNETGTFTSIDMTQNEACKLHQDWRFILQEQDAQHYFNMLVMSLLMTCIIRFFNFNIRSKT
jgi:hypothetical protein